MQAGQSGTYARVFQNHARDRDALLLSAGQFQPALTDNGVITLRQAIDKIVDVGDLRRLPHLIHARILIRILDVVVDGVVEQHRILRHDADVLAQAGLSHVADVLPVDQDAAVIRFVKTEQQSRQRGLAGAGRPDHGDLAPGFDFETDVVQYPAIAVVRKSTFSNTTWASSTSSAAAVLLSTISAFVSSSRTIMSMSASEYFSAR